MNRRSLLFALVVCLCLLGTGLWQLSLPRERSKVYKPVGEARLDEDPDSPVQPLAGELGSPLDEPAPEIRKLAPPPTPPVVENDPAKGRVWVRLLDAETNQPLRNTKCEFCEIQRFAYYSFNLEFIDTQTVTDHDGLVSLSACLFEDSSSVLESWDVVLVRGKLEKYRLPIPKDWLPQESARYIAELIEILPTSPASVPIDVFVAPTADLRIVARDEWGLPVQGATLEYAVAGGVFAAECWLALREDVTESASESDWESWVAWQTGQRRVANVNAVFDKVSIANNYKHVRTFFFERKAFDSTGSALVRGLPCVRVMALAQAAGLGVGQTSIDLAPGDNELNVYLRAQPACTLNVRIEWHGKPLSESESPSLNLNPTGPFGKADDKRFDPGDSDLRWRLAPNGSTTWQGEITGLMPGYWRAAAEFGYGNDGSASVRLEAGKAGDVTLYCGEGALAGWAPVIMLGSQCLPQTSIFILGGEYFEPTEETVEFDGESNLAKMIELQAGEYTVWIPTLPPQTITLQPGERRGDVFHLQCARVRFSIDENLASLLSFEGGDVQLNANPDDEWEWAQDHLFAIDEGMRQNDEAYDQLRPGVVREWLIPYGTYRWDLVGADQSIGGRLEVTGDTSFNFGLHSLPGYALCDVEFVGFAAGEEPDIEFRRDSAAEYAINAFDAGKGSRESFTTRSSPRPKNGIDVYGLRPGEGTIVYAFSSEGSAQLRVGRDGSYSWFRVNFPGRMVITLGHLSSEAECVLRFDRNGSEGEHHVCALHDNGDYDECQSYDELEMPAGWVTLVVSRKRVVDGHSEYATASVRVNLTPKSQTLDLTTLTYDAMAQVTLTFRGRGSPDSPFDAWWYGAEQPEPVLQALDQSFGGSPRYVSLGEPDKVLPEGKLEFSYQHRMLPAGRYKVIPWPGAAEKYCKTFTVAPGETATVVVEGGS